MPRDTHRHFCASLPAGLTDKTNAPPLSPIVAMNFGLCFQFKTTLLNSANNLRRSTVLMCLRTARAIRVQSRRFRLFPIRLAAIIAIVYNLKRSRHQAGVSSINRVFSQMTTERIRYPSDRPWPRARLWRFPDIPQNEKAFFAGKQHILTCGTLCLLPIARPGPGMISASSHVTHLHSAQCHSR